MEPYGFLIEKTAKKLKQHFQREFTRLESGITVDQWGILDALNHRDGISQNEIAEITYKDAPTVTRIIDLLIQKDLIRRQPDGIDRRRHNVYLSEQGRAKIAELMPAVNALREKGWQKLGDKEYQQLVGILHTVYTNFD